MSRSAGRGTAVAGEGQQGAPCSSAPNTGRTCAHTHPFPALGCREPSWGAVRGERPSATSGPVRSRPPAPSTRCCLKPSPWVFPAEAPRGVHGGGSTRDQTQAGGEAASASTLERGTAPGSGPRDPQKNGGGKRGLAPALDQGTPREEPSRPEESQQTPWVAPRRGPMSSETCVSRPDRAPVKPKHCWLPPIPYRNQPSEKA